MARKRKIHPILNRVHIEGIAQKGKAVGRTPEGAVIFVSDAIPGDVVDIQVLKKRRNFWEGKAVHYHTLSNDRIKPKCSHFGECGGCKWQHMKYEAQLLHKQKEVIEALTHIGHLNFPHPHPIIGCDETYHYRNKMEFSFSNNRWLSHEEIQDKDMVVERNGLGFHKPGMWDKIVDIEECHLQGFPSNEIRNEIKRYALKHQLEFYDPRNKNGFLRSLMIRISSLGEVMVVIQFFREQAKDRMALLDHLLQTFPKITSLQYIINNKGNDSIYDQKIICYNNRDFITEQMGALYFQITAKSFYQTNSHQAKVLYDVVKDFAGLSGNERVYDLYTGLGTIAQYVAHNAKHVIGIESVPDAIVAARYNAKKNKINNTTFEIGDMKKVFNPEFITKYGHPDVVIADPPRDGMHKDVTDQLLQLNAKRIVYVSCNPSTQARDLAILSSQYAIQKVQPVDMFPHTQHVENVVLLNRKENE